MTLSCLWLNQGKTCIWNQVGQMPIGRERLEAAARVENPDARMWRGEDGTFSERSIILGTLVGTPEFVQQQLEQKVVEHETFLQRIPELVDLQRAWLLLLFYGVARANFFLRTNCPALSHSFATRHDAQILHSSGSWPRCSLSLSAGSAVQRNSDSPRIGELGRHHQDGE